MFGSAPLLHVAYRTLAVDAALREQSVRTDNIVPQCIQDLFALEHRVHVLDDGEANDGTDLIGSVGLHGQDHSIVNARIARDGED